MSQVMADQIRHLQERLTAAERERDEWRAVAGLRREALRSFAEKYRNWNSYGRFEGDGVETEHFARAAELVPA